LTTELRRGEGSAHGTLVTVSSTAESSSTSML